MQVYILTVTFVGRRKKSEFSKEMFFTSAIKTIKFVREKSMSPLFVTVCTHFPPPCLASSLLIYSS